MGRHPRVTIIITCYNYGRFLRECIDSALNQTYADTEIIVVDDGSTDNSRGIMVDYGAAIVPVLKANGGMASAFNAGFKRSRGDIVCFVDADDTLLPMAVKEAVERFDADVVKVHWPLFIVDEHGLEKGVYPLEALPEGNLRECAIRGGYTGYVWPMTTGNAWARNFLERVFPIPEDEFRGSAESYLAALAPAVGSIRRVLEPMGRYRLHGKSLSNTRPLRQAIQNIDRQYSVLRSAFAKMGVAVDSDSWPPTPATRRDILLACEELAGLIPAGSKLIFVEWGVWGPGQVVAGCAQIPFLEKDGQHWGMPPDDEIAIRELERLRRGGAEFIVFAAPAFWWLEYYSEFRRYLVSEFRCALENERVIVFDLKQ